MASDKNTAIIVVAGLAVVGILAYVAYKVLKPIGAAAKTVSNIGDTVKGVNDWFAGVGHQITDGFGGVESSLSGVPKSAQSLGIDLGSAIGNFWMGQQNQHTTSYWTPSPAEQAALVQRSYEILGGVAPGDSPAVVASKIANARDLEAQQILRAQQGGFGGL